MLLFDTGRLDKQDQPIYKLTYPGFFQPKALHINADTGDTWVAIEFACESDTKTVIAKQSDLATKSAIIKTLTSKGAFITESNAALCCDFISSFLSLNRGNLLKKRFTERLGFHDGDVFVLPNKTIGDDNLQYNGDLPNEQPQDDEIYANTVKTIFNDWGNDAWPTLMVLGYSLSSPFIQKLGIKRNPIIALTGRSGYGKSTLIRFALSAWGDGTQKPFTIEGSVPTTPIGFAQNVAGLNGLPCFFDEINLADKHRGNVIKWRDAAIAFANGQTRLRGSKDNELKAQGGNRVKGVLFGAGESLPDLKVEGVFNRQLVIDVTENPPLGVAGRVGIKQNPIGHERAGMLEDAADQGAGVLGISFVKYILSKWDEFESNYKTLRNQWGRAFNEHTDSVCLCVVTLNYLCNLLNIENRQPIQALIDNVSKFFVSYQNQENHPAMVAIEELRSLIASSEQATRYVGGEVGIEELPYYKKGNQPFFWLDGDHYVVPSNNEVLKGLGDLKPFYNKWREIGFIVPSNDGKNTQKKRSRIGTGSARCLVIPKSFLDNSNDVPPVPPINIKVEPKNITNNKSVPPVPPVPPQNTNSQHLFLGDENISRDNNYYHKHLNLGGTGGTDLNLNENLRITESGTSGTGGTGSNPQLQDCDIQPPNWELPPIEAYADIDFIDNQDDYNQYDHFEFETQPPAKPPAQKPAVVSGGLGQKVPDPNKWLTQQIKQYLNKNGTGSFGDLINSLGQTEKSRQAAREQLKYLESQGVVGIYDNGSGYTSVFLVDRLAN